MFSRVTAGRRCPHLSPRLAGRVGGASSSHGLSLPSDPSPRGGPLAQLWRRRCSSDAGAPADGTGAAPDHRQIGVRQGLFATSPYSPGSPILLPSGALVFNRLVGFLRRQYVRYGFSEVITPTIYKKALWRRSGHLDNYAEDMYTVTPGGGATTTAAAAAADNENENDDADDDDDAAYGLKPMNCPGHCLIFAHERRSYRELPVRYADFSPLHRNEASGALSGLTRVRRFHQDDGHIFCRPAQIEGEIARTLDFVRVVYATLGLGPYRLALSTRPADGRHLGDAAEWDHAEAALRRALDASGRPWALRPGDGAFYGPKIDVVLRDSDAKDHQTATVQLDFQLPKRFGLAYLAPAPAFERRGQTTTDPDELARSGLVTPVLIHRAVLGSVERLMALLIEHYNGKWPFWLNPKQVIIVTVNDSEPVVGLARTAQDILTGRDGPADAPVSNLSHLVVDIDDRGISLGLKVREAKTKGYGVIVTVGPRQVPNGTVTADLSRLGGGGDAGAKEEMTPQELLALLKAKADSYQ